MEALRIAFKDFWPEWGQEDFITPILKEKYNVIVDDRNPQVLFHSIFGGMKEAPKYRCKKVLILGENHRPSKFGSDYSISFDPHSETNFRLPLWQMFILNNPTYWDRLVNRVRHQSFERFCSFIVSNPSNSFRNNSFDRLHERKRVHSYGRVRTNSLELRRASEGQYWRDAKDRFFTDHPHKFMFSIENTTYPYYCTEKLMDSFLSGSIPLYWGDPKVGEDWNSEAFINLGGNSEWINIIERADADPQFFESIYSKPVFTEEQERRHRENLNNFREWLLRIP